jgi:hypothetical protein
MNKVEKLKSIKKVIQHGETKVLSELSGVHSTIISQYLNHAGKIVMNKIRLDAILKAWDKIEDEKIRNY